MLRRKEVNVNEIKPDTKYKLHKVGGTPMLLPARLHRPSSTKPPKPAEKLPNAPKYQPCLKCNAPVKRTKKTSSRAEYHCKKCGTNNIVSLKERR